MKIGILGSGNVGGTLGSRWAQGGHQVIFGTREAESAKMKELLAKAGKSARAASSQEAVAASDVVLLATPWPATQSVLAAAGDLSGKVLIDLVNPLLPDLSGMAVGMTTSAAEQIAGWVPGARVVKAFNTVGQAVMADPVVAGEKVVLFYCGDDAAAKGVVAQLATELGFDARDAGPLTQARLLEPFALLWISLAFGQKFGFHWGFKVLQ